MFGIGLWEILAIVAIILLFFGAKDLPKLARSVGKLFFQLRRAGDELREAVEVEMDTQGVKEPPGRLERSRAAGTGDEPPDGYPESVASSEQDASPPAPEPEAQAAADPEPPASADADDQHSAASEDEADPSEQAAADRSEPNPPAEERTESLGDALPSILDPGLSGGDGWKHDLRANLSLSLDLGTERQATTTGMTSAGRSATPAAPRASAPAPATTKAEPSAPATPRAASPASVAATPGPSSPARRISTRELRQKVEERRRRTGGSARTRSSQPAPLADLDSGWFSAPEKPASPQQRTATPDKASSPPSPKAEEPKPEEPKPEEPKPEEPKPEEPKPEEPKPEEPKPEEPKPAKPKAAKPKTPKPKSAEPKAEEPKAEKPKRKRRRRKKKSAASD